MAKIKKRVSFCGLNLPEEIEEEFKKLLVEKDLRAKQLIRALVKQWVDERGAGVLKYYNKRS